jgi:hypothetical protein
MVIPSAADLELKEAIIDAKLAILEAQELLHLLYFSLIQLEKEHGKIIHRKGSGRAVPQSGARSTSQRGGERSGSIISSRNQFSKVVDGDRTAP